MSRDVQGLDLKDVFLNRGKGKQPPLPSEPTDPASDADMKASTLPELANTFHNYPTSNAIWKYLQDRFMNKTAVGVAILIPSMFQVHLEDCSRMANNIAKVQTIHGELPEQAPAAAFLVGLTSAYEVTRKMLLTSSAEDLTFAKVSSALLSVEKDSTAQAKAYALRAPVPQASVASALFQRNRFPPCTHVVKYGNRNGQVCGGTNHPLATCFKKKDDEWYAIHGVDKKPPNWIRPRKTNLVEVQDPASASASDSAPADVLARFTLNSSGLYTLCVPIPHGSTTQAQADITPCSCRSFANPTILYHHRLGHPNFRTLADMASKKLLLGLPASLPPPPDSPAPSCLDCTKSKLRQQPHPASPSVAAAPLDLVHMDIWGPAPVPARGGYRYFLAQTIFDRKVKRLHSDGGGEFGNDKLKAFCSSEGILQNFTLPHSPQQNGITESRNHTLVQSARCLLSHSHAPLSLSLSLGIRPLPCYPPLQPLPPPASSRHHSHYTLARENTHCSPSPRPPSLVWADFDAPPDLPPAPAPSPSIEPSPSGVSDTTSPVSSAAAPPSPSSPTIPTTPQPPSAPITYHRRSNPPAPPPPPAPSSTQEPALPQPSKLITYQRRPIPPPQPPKLTPPVPPAPPSSPVAHGTRSHGAAPPLALAIQYSAITLPPPAGGDVPPTLLEDKHEELCDLHAVIPQLSHIFPDITESPSLNFSKNPTIPIPSTVQEAFSSLHTAEWGAAMEAECEAFTRNHSFDDKTPPPEVNIVWGNWLFRVKQLPDEAPMFKARYVAKGFTQQQYFDFFKTFSPTSKPPTVRTLLNVAAREDFEIKSMNASSAFVQGHLKETVFMDRPEGFPGEFPPNTLNKLNRPVYGLKQAPREWHNKMKDVLLSLDFRPSSADATLFIRRHSKPFYIMVYVDDFILVAKDSAQMTSVQEALSKIRTISLSQEFYINNVLKRFEMELCTPMATRLPLQHLLTAPAVPTPEACTEPYPELVGSLMYAMMCTGPDLTYPISVLSRYVAPGRFTDLHWKAAKRVLRYLQGTK
ncbi:unnamed protein product [Closterium sp. NIES-53]